VDSTVIIEAVVKTSQTASLLALESLQITLGEGWSTGLQGKGHYGVKGMFCEVLPVGRKPCWCPLSTGLVGSFMGKIHTPFLQVQEVQTQLHRTAWPQPFAFRPAGKSCGSLGVNCGNP